MDTAGPPARERIPPNESMTHRTGKKLDRWITVILALAVVLLLADKFVLHKDAETAAAAAVDGKSTFHTQRLPKNDVAVRCRQRLG
jgi:hypothetical protein